MALVTANLLNATGMPQGNADYVYVSDTDDRATVAASGYFNNTDDNQNLAADDLIHVRGDQGVYTLQVAADTDGVITTASPDTNSNYEVITGTTTVTAAESGKHYVLNTVTAFVTTLPVPALGLEYWFHIGATAPTTSHTVVTNASANIIEGSITSPEVSALVSVVAAADTISFVANLAVHGDRAHLWCDGTTWLLDGTTFVQDGMTTTQAS